MSRYVKIVTNPENGWDCVVAVYTDHASDEEIQEKWPEDQYIIHRKRVENRPEA